MTTFKTNFFASSMAPIIDKTLLDGEALENEDGDELSTNLSDGALNTATLVSSPAWSTQTLVLIVVLALLILIALMLIMVLHVIKGSNECPSTSRVSDSDPDFWHELQQVASCNRSGLETSPALSGLNAMSIPEEGTLLHYPSTMMLAASPAFGLQIQKDGKSIVRKRSSVVDVGTKIDS